MKMTGKELFLVNKFTAASSGLLFFNKRDDDDDSLKLKEVCSKIGEVVSAFHQGNRASTIPFDAEKKLIKLFCPPTTAVKDINRTIKKMVNHYYGRETQEGNFYQNDIVLDISDGQLFRIINATPLSDFRVIYECRDIRGYTKQFEARQLIKLKL